jgi:hypothetical protein
MILFFGQGSDLCRNVRNEPIVVLALRARQFLTDHDTVAVVIYTGALRQPTGKTCRDGLYHSITIRDSKIVRFREFSIPMRGRRSFSTGLSLACTHRIPGRLAAAVIASARASWTRPGLSRTSAFSIHSIGRSSKSFGCGGGAGWHQALPGALRLVRRV